MELTIIIPAYNEEEGISDTIRELLPRAGKSGWKVTVINDGSTDRTGEILNGIEGIRVISHPYNKGYGASLKTGIVNSDTEYIAFYDADGQHSPEELGKLRDSISNYEMLVGHRGKDSHQDWVRKPGKWVLSKVANFLTGRKIPDLNSGLRVVNRKAILGIIHLLPDGFSLSTTSTIAFMNLGYNVGYIPIKVSKRVGKSSVKQLKHGSNVILLIIRLIVLFNPLKVFIPMSLFLFFAGMIYEIIYGVIIIFPKVKLVPAAFFAILSSILIFFFGLVVDQLSELRKHKEKYIP